MPKDLKGFLEGQHVLGQEGWVGVSTGGGSRVWVDGWGQGAGIRSEQGGPLPFSFPSDSISIFHVQSSSPQFTILRGCYETH